MPVKAEEQIKTYQITEKQLSELQLIKDNLENGIISKKEAARSIRYLVEDIVGY